MAENRFLILVEGVADLIFIKDLILYINPQINDFRIDEKDTCKKPILLSTQKNNEKLIIKILNTGGYTRLINLKSKIKPYLEKDYKILIIFDADSSQKKGGFQERKKEIEKILREKLKILDNYNIFLLPNNHDDGDLETLLLQITNKKFFSPFERYLVNYSQNIKDLKKEINLAQDTFYNEILSKKSKVFNYIQAYQGKGKANEKNRNYLNEEIKLWIFEDNNLTPLINFIKKVLKIQ